MFRPQAANNRDQARSGSELGRPSYWCNVRVACCLSRTVWSLVFFSFFFVILFWFPFGFSFLFFILFLWFFSHYKFGFYPGFFLFLFLVFSFLFSDLVLPMVFFIFCIYIFFSFCLFIQRFYLCNNKTIIIHFKCSSHNKKMFNVFF